MTYFIRNGNTFRTTDETNLDIHKKLPPGNYVIRQTPFGEMYFEAVDNFEFKTKLYGDTTKNTKRILDTFMSRSVSTGVMLTGEKGSGKSLLAKMVSIEAAKMDIPTIIINTPWHGDSFNTFIQSIEQPAILLFDEFEKVYDQEQQQSLLTLLDGVFPSKKLFMLTCNDKWRVDTHMRNRPGRIFYMLDFQGLSVEFIEEYCKDNLKNQQHIQRICTISGLFAQFNFDMLKALVEEMNRYDEAPEVALEILNVRPEFDGGSTYTVKIIHDGVEHDSDSGLPAEWRGNPFEKRIVLEYYTRTKRPPTLTVSPNNDMVEMDHDDTEWHRVTFTHRHLKKSDANKFVFENETGVVLVLTKVQEVKYNYYGAF